MKNIRPKNGTAILALLLAATGLLVLSGCRNPLSPPREAAIAERGVGTLSLTIGGSGGAARTIAPVWPGDGSLRLDLGFAPSYGCTGGNEAFSVPDWNQGDPVELYAGRWDLAVRAFRVDGGVATKIAEGSRLGIPVEPGAGTNITVALSPIRDGNGTFIWEITILDGFEISAGESTLAITPVGGGTWSHSGAFSATGTMSIPAGVYRVVFTLACANGERENAVIRELLHVYGNMTSAFAETLGELHFPTSLLSIILNAINNPVHGTIQASLYAAGVRAGHFPLLGINGVEDLGDTDFHGFLGRFDSLVAGPIRGEDLANLVDAALVAELADRDRVYANRDHAETSIRGLVANGDPAGVSFAWAGTRSVTVAVAGFVVTIGFNTDVYDHMVTFDPNGGGGGQGHILAYSGQAVTLPGSPGKGFDYLFTGWNTQANGGGRQHLGGSPFTVTGDVTLFAVWTLATGDTIQVILASGVGSVADIPLTSVPPGTEIILPPLPGEFANPGHFFTGWSAGGAVGLFPVGSTFAVTGPGSPVVLSAQWEAIVGDAPLTCTVRIEPNVEGAGVAIVMSVPQGTTITLPHGGFAREWYDLLPRWYIQAAGGTGHGFGESVLVDGDITLYARWHRPGFTVSFDVAGGSTVPGLEGGGTGTRNVLRGKTIDLPVLERANYTFVGWSTEIDGERIHLGLSPFLVVRDTRLQAEWEPGDPEVFTVTFAPNGGAGDDIVTIAVAGTTITLPGGGFTKADHAFVGWRYGTPDGLLHVGLAPFTVSRDARLYASWIPAPAGSAPPATFTVTFRPNHADAAGEAFSLVPVPQGTTITLPSAGFTKHQHFLYGWARAAVGVGGARDYALNAQFDVAGDVDLFAVWRFATVENVAVSPALVTVARGETRQFTAQVTGQGSPPQDVNWTLSGTVSPGTGIDPSSGLLTVAAGQTPGNGIFIVRAVSPHNQDVVGTAPVNVPEPTVTGVKVIPRVFPAQAQRGGSVEFDLEITGPGHPGAGGALVEWSVVSRGEGYPAIFDGTTVTGTNLGGTLAIAPSPNQALGYVDVQARVTNWIAAPGGNATGIQNARIMPPTGFMVQIGGFTVTPVPVERGEGHQFTVAVTGGQGYPGDGVVWTVSGATKPGTSVDASNWFNLAGTEPYNNQAGNIITLRSFSVCNPEIFGTVEVRMVGRMHLGSWRRVTAGVDHTMGITWENRLYTWGNQTNGGQLGHLDPDAAIAGSPAVTSPRRVGDHFWRYASGGWGHTTGIRMDGTLWEWGRWHGFHGADPVPGHNVPTQVRIAGAAEGDYATGWVYLVAGHGHNLAIRQGPSGERWLYGWGNSREGRLGLGTPMTGNNTVVRHPTRVPVGDDWDSVSTGMWHSAGLRDGIMYVWGRNTRGQLGPGGESNVPRRLDTGDWPARWRAVAVGGNIGNTSGFTVALCHEYGHMYVWGSNNDGALGPFDDDFGVISNTPRRVRINGADHEWESVHLNGTRHVIAIDTDGVLWTWGRNYHGAIGDGPVAGGGTPTGTGTNAIRATPFRIEATGGRTWDFSLGSGSASMAIDNMGYLWAWGHNNPHGQLGLGDTVNRLVPTQVPD
ncbi:MAG: InlB B-repeat-containing protein [Treponema sp.]|nr:InlB B-repeat-containing protein [Treponema sp.]